jgi:hypothetical protein
MTVVMLAVFIAMVGIASQYPPDARFMPFVAGIPAIALCLLQLYLDLRRSRRVREHETARQKLSRITGGRIDFDMARERPAAVRSTPHSSATVRRELALWGYFLGLVGGVLLFGFMATIPVFVVVFLRQWAKTSWAFALGLAAAASTVLYLVFIQGLKVGPHPGFVTGFILERIFG